MPTFAEQIGLKIRLHRITQKLTQEQLAEKSNTTASYIGQLERGEKDARIHTIEKVAVALDISVNELFNDGQETFLQEKKWVWECLLLLLRQEKEKQHHAYRILKEVLEPGILEQE